VPDGIAVGEWVTSTARGLTGFYDIDTPVTLARVARREREYLNRALIARYDLYLSFTGGPTLARLERRYGARRARVLYCSADPELYYRERRELKWDLGYLGTYSEDRQPALDALFLEPARRLPGRRLVLGGSMYPDSFPWRRTYGSSRTCRRPIIRLSTVLRSSLSA
jgi:spore maturation protein CgeB